MTSADDGFAHLHDLAQQTAERLTRSLRAVGPSTAQSERGSVTVSLDADGSVASVLVVSTWRQEVTAEGFGALVLSTLAAARAQQFAGWARELDQAMTAQVTRRPLPPVAPSRREIRGAQGDRLNSDAIRAVGGLHGAMDELVEAMRAISSAEHEGRSAGGHAVAAANAQGEVLRLELDLEWLEGAQSVRIGHEVTEALTRAVALAREHPPTEAVARSRLGRLQRILSGTPTATDPENGDAR
jgi:DNA-binding protein YbaB